MSANFLFEMALKASVVLVVALAATQLMSAWASAAARHLVWVTAIAGIVLLPALMLFGPAWHVAFVPGAWAARADAVLRLSTRASRALGSAEVWPVTARVTSHAPVDLSSGVSTSPATLVESTPSFTWAHRPTWPVLIVGVWAAGTLFALLRLLVGLLWAHWLTRRATPVVAPEWLALKKDAEDLIGSSRDVALRLSERVGVPVACGILRPMLLLSPQAETWDEERRKIVLLHELAHVKRHDCLVQVLAQVARAVHWFNPLAFVAMARLHEEQERACDDLVLEAGTPASDYADHLCEIVRTSRVTRAPAWATLAVARPSRLHDRVLAILDKKLSRQSPSWRFCISLSLLLCIGVVPLGVARPLAAIEAMSLLPSAALDRIGPYASLVEYPHPSPLTYTSPNTLAVNGAAPAASGTAASPRAVMDDDGAREFVSTYCTSCHNDQRRTANVSLATLSLATVPDNRELSEKIVRKLRSGLHPPASLARPDRTAADAFSASLEATIDRADQANWGPDLVAQISDRELASRLSTFLWNSDPDAELLKVAAGGKLRDPSELQRQVRRMIADSRSSAMLTRFFGQWLYIDQLDKKLKTASPDFDPSLTEAFRREIDLFLASQVRDDRSAVDLLTANYSFVNDRLARHYGMANVTGSEFRRVALTDDSRFGLLGKAAILFLTSYGNRTSPVVRGKYVLETFLGVNAPPPPANVPALKALGPDDPPMSMRQRLEAHQKNPVCASCHSGFDSFGYALENFDNLGGWRTMDGTPIDASGKLADGTEFTGPAGLRSVLVDRQELFVSTLTLKLLAYSLGRPAKYSDMPAVRTVLAETAPNRYRWSSLIVSLVKSLPFQTRPITP